MPVTLRKKSTEAEYQHLLDKGLKHCIYCEQELLVAEFQYWVLLKNRFPYDRIAKDHWMLAPKRHIPTEKQLTREENKELERLLEILNYDCVLINKKPKRTLPDHYHLHLLKL